MSARTALEKLRRTRLNGRRYLPMHGGETRPAHTRRLDALSVPPATGTHLVCEDWPECQCDGDCGDQAASEHSGWVRLALPLLIALVLVGAWLAIIGGLL